MSFKLRTIFYVAILTMPLYTLSGCTPPDEGKPEASPPVTVRVSDSPSLPSQPDKNTNSPITRDSKKNPAGIFLGKKYKSVGAGPYYVFSDSSVTVYRTISYGYIFKNNEVERWVQDVGAVNGDIAITDSFTKLIPVKYASDPGSGIKLYKAAELDAVAIAKKGDDYPILKDAPVTYLEHSVRVDWSACQPETACTDFGADSESEVFNVESDGLILSSATNPNHKLQVED